MNDDLSVSVKATRLADNQLAMWYLGQLGYLFLYRGKTVLCDPYLSDYVDRHHTEPAWKRVYAPPVSPAALDFVDYVFCSHAHADHTDPETLLPLMRTNDRALFFGTPAVCRRYTEIGIPSARIRVLSNDETHALTTFLTVTQIPAAHEVLHPDADGQYEECGFRFTFGAPDDALPPITVYHSGDCCPYPGLEERIVDTDIMILPINGRDYFRLCDNIIGNFDVREAVLLAKHAGCDLLIPAHHDLYPANALSPAVFVETLEQHNPTQRYHIFRPGERMVYMKS